MLANTSAVSRELTGVVADDEQELAPTLEKLNRINAMTRKTGQYCQGHPRPGQIELTQGEIGRTALLQRVIPNISPAQILQPFLDCVFRFRRGLSGASRRTTLGRRQLPFPVNGIPRPGDLPNDGNP